MLVTKGFYFKSLLFNAIPHFPEGSGERLLGHYDPLVSFFEKKKLGLGTLSAQSYQSYNIEIVKVYQMIHFNTIINALAF